ncbi:MAG: CsgG/HfaB family protein [Gemmatimonadota bacterium]
MRTLRYGLLGLLALIAVPRVIYAQDDKPTVAVLHFNATALARGNISDVGSALLDMITTEFSKKQSVRVVDRSQVEDLLTKQKLLVSGRLSDEAAMRAGQLLGAQYIVYGGVFVERNVARLDIRITESETGKILRSFKQSGKEDNLIALVETLTDDFTKDLSLPAKAALAEAVVPVDAILTYSRGLDFEKRGKRAQAADMYEKSLQLSPSYEDAQKALARVK